MARALFIGSPFFDYYRHIRAALTDHGFEVDHYNDRPSENALVKGAIRVRPRLVTTVVENYLASIHEETRGRDYDLIVVLNGKALTPSFLARLRREHPRAEAVLYLWDAVALYPHVLDLAPLFDRTFTFDAEDALTHPGLRFLPLFFTHDFGAVGSSEAEPDLDLVNVCTAHPNRYAVMRTLVPELRATGLKVFSYLYLNPLQLAYNRVRSDEFAGARLSEFELRPLSTSDYVDVVRRSRAVMDVSHSAQTGLTMRTIETLGAGRKLVTTNAAVTRYPFYDPSRVLLVDMEHLDPQLIHDFVVEPYAPVDDGLRALYGIDSWVDQLLSGEDSVHESVLRH